MTEITVDIAAADARKIELFAQAEAHALIQVPGIEVVMPHNEEEIKKSMLRVASFAILCAVHPFQDHTQTSLDA